MSDDRSTSEAKLRARRAALGLGSASGPSASSRSAAAMPVSAAEDLLSEAPADAALRDKAMFICFAVIAISATFLQCFGIPLGSTDTIGALILAVVPLAFLSMCFYVRPIIDPVRLGLFVLLVAAAMIGTAATANRYSSGSLALFIVLYIPFIVAFPVSESTWRRCLNFFVTIMIVIAGVEFLQHAIQLTAGRASLPNLYKIVPQGWMIPDYNYMQPIVWQSPYIKPQAFVFLEASMLSQYLALALCIEVALFQRVWRIVVLVAAVFGTFAGTGLLLLVFALPVLLGRMSMRNMILIALAILVVAAVAANAGWLDTVSHRFNEFGKSGRSANHRFVEPLDRIVALFGSPASFYSGIGAGQIEKTDNHQFWPIAKAMVEYGLLTGILFYAFLIRAMFARPPMRALAFTLLLWFSFEGSLLTAVNPLTCVFLSSMFVIDRTERRSGGRGQAAQSDQMSEARSPAMTRAA